MSLYLAFCFEYIKQRSPDISRVEMKNEKGAEYRYRESGRVRGRVGAGSGPGRGRVGAGSGQKETEGGGGAWGPHYNTKNIFKMPHTMKGQNFGSSTKKVYKKILDSKNENIYL